jgi:hypothetical protein
MKAAVEEILRVFVKAHDVLAGGEEKGRRRR